MRKTARHRVPGYLSRETTRLLLTVLPIDVVLNRAELRLLPRKGSGTVVEAAVVFPPCGAVDRGCKRARHQSISHSRGNASPPFSVLNRGGGHCWLCARAVPPQSAAAPTTLQWPDLSAPAGLGPTAPRLAALTSGDVPCHDAALGSPPGCRVARASRKTSVGNTVSSDEGWRSFRFPINRAAGQWQPRFQALGCKWRLGKTTGDGACRVPCICAAR